MLMLRSRRMIREMQRASVLPEVRIDQIPEKKKILSSTFLRREFLMSSLFSSVNPTLCNTKDAK